jgi:hypothetical protein
MGQKEAPTSGQEACAQSEHFVNLNEFAHRKGFVVEKSPLHSLTLDGAILNECKRLVATVDVRGSRQG